MDIQKEREEFEGRFPISAHWIDFDGLTCKYICKYNAIDDQTLKYQARWEAWLAAKAQAVPEGFVLVPKEPTKEMIRMGDLTFGHDECVDARKVYKAMLEAQEPAND